MFARLWEITSTRICCAAMPVAAMFSARMLSFSPCRGSALAEGGDDLADALVLLVEEPLAGLVGALHLDHPRHLDDRADIRAFEEALDDAAVLDRKRWRVGAEQGAGLAEE